MNFWLILVALGLGFRHAVAPDHLAAVGTYTEKTHATRRQGVLYALRIAGGHSAGMCMMAGLIIGLLTALPPAWVAWTTWGSGLWLMVMALWILWDLVRDIRPVRPLATAPKVVRHHPRMDSWIKNPATAWFVGLLFGVAVSPGDLAIFTLMVKTHGNLGASIGLLVLFFLAMFTGLSLVGGGLGWANTRRSLRRAFQALSGVAGMGIALALVTGYLH